MKSGRVFWGTFFLVPGGLFLIDHFTPIDTQRTHAQDGSRNISPSKDLLPIGRQLGVCGS